MSTQITPPIEEIDYPTGDGTPVAETPIHRDNLLETIWMLEEWFKDQKRDDVYVSGNMFVYYVKGDRRRHLSPDIFVVHDVGNQYRDCYKTWEESKPTLDLVIEFTSWSTKEEDLEDKFELYRDQLGVQEYLLFDPYGEYLEPPQQLYRLIDGEYVSVESVDGRLPSKVLDMHFERDDRRLRLWIPQTGDWLPFPAEIAADYRNMQVEYAKLKRKQESQDADILRLQAELESLKRRVSETDGNGGE